MDWEYTWERSVGSPDRMQVDPSDEPMEDASSQPRTAIADQPEFLRALEQLTLHHGSGPSVGTGANRGCEAYNKDKADWQMSRRQPQAVAPPFFRPGPTGFSFGRNNSNASAASDLQAPSLQAAPATAFSSLSQSATTTQHTNQQSQSQASTMFKTGGGGGLGLSINTGAANNASSQPAQPAQGGGLFGNANQNNQPQQPQQPQQQSGGGLFGNGAQNQQGQQGQQQQGGGLFGGSQQQQQQKPASGGLFGGLNQQNQNQQPSTGGGGGLFGGANNQQNQGQQAQQQQGGGLFGNSQQQQQKPAGGLFGGLNQQSQPSQPSNTGGGGLLGQSQNQNKPAGGLFGQSTNAPAQNSGLTMGQSTNQQQSVPAVRVDLANIKGTTKFNDLLPELQEEIQKCDDVIQTFRQQSDQIVQFLSGHRGDIDRLTHDVNWLKRKFDGVKTTLEDDVKIVANLKDLVKSDADIARGSFAGAEQLKLPAHYHTTWLTAAASSKPSDEATKTKNGRLQEEPNLEDCITLFNREAARLDELHRFQVQKVKEMEQHMPGVENGLYERMRALRDGAPQFPGFGYATELLDVVKALGDEIVRSAGQIIETREKLTQLQLRGIPRK